MPGEFVLNGPLNIWEGRGQTITVGRIGDQTGSASVSWGVDASASTANAADFLNGQFPSGQISFAPGEVFKTFTIFSAEDQVRDGDKRIVLVLRDPIGATLNATLSRWNLLLEDNDRPDLLTGGTAALVPAAEGQPQVFTFIRANASEAFSFPYAVVGYGSSPANGADFVGGAFPSGVLTFGLGELTKSLTISTTVDGVSEPEEGFQLSIRNGLPANTTAGSLVLFATGSITNPLPTLTLSGPSSVHEGDFGQTFLNYTITRSGDLSVGSVVSYGSSGTVSGIDFNTGQLPSGQITFGFGESVKTFRVDVAGDSTVEPDEVLTVFLNSPANAVLGPTASVTTAIVNDDLSAAPAAAFLTTAYGNILKLTPNSSDASWISGVAAQVGLGSLTRDQAISKILDFADATTSVATMAYEFFTGKIPSAGGMDYLVSPTGPNPNNLNSAYYQAFGVENRYINFAVNLGKVGEGAAKFTADYGGLDLFAATTKAYTTIFGTAPTAEKVHALLDPSFVLGGVTMTRAQYFAAYGQDGPNGIGTKAAMVGWLLAEAEKADIGTYAKANHAFLVDLADGAAYAVDLVGVYGKPEFAL